MVERGFVKIYKRMLMMMTHVRIHENLKTGIWPKCAATATKLKNIMIKPHKGNAQMRTSMEQFRNTQNT